MTSTAKGDAWSDISLGPVRRCAVCGKPFTPVSNAARYCSLACRDEATRERKCKWNLEHPRATVKPYKNAKVDSYCPFRGDVADEINRMRGELGR